MDRKAYTPLRIAVLVAAGLGSAFWLGSLVVLGVIVVALASDTRYGLGCRGGNAGERPF